jgi:nitroimidazol reductase NimA-like FMN-containing flavoprotein (pyridoxamine 5'-phosphate oxidase superfamily)
MDEDFHQKARALIRDQGTCVLATASQNRPHCSLMAYSTNDSCDEIYLITPRDSHKYKNMLENPAVSLLIDTRQNTSDQDHNEIIALTVSGRFQGIIENSEQERIRKELSRKHPELKDFFENSESEPVKIIIESIMFLEGPNKLHYGVIAEL